MWCTHQFSPDISSHLYVKLRVSKLVWIATHLLKMVNIRKLFNFNHFNHEKLGKGYTYYLFKSFYFLCFNFLLNVILKKLFLRYIMKYM